MKINKEINYNASIVIGDVSIAILSANVNSRERIMTLSVNVTDEVVLAANELEAQEQYAIFEKEVKANARELGFIVFVEAV